MYMILPAYSATSVNEFLPLGKSQRLPEALDGLISPQRQHEVLPLHEPCVRLKCTPHLTYYPHLVACSSVSQNFQTQFARTANFEIDDNVLENTTRRTILELFR